MSTKLRPSCAGQAEDRRGSDDSRVAIGQTPTGRYLRVVYVRDPEPQSFFGITAYELRGQPLTAYQRRQRRKGYADAIFTLTCTDCRAHGAKRTTTLTSKRL
jgi:hypothetical protein